MVTIVLLIFCAIKVVMLLNKANQAIIKADQISALARANAVETTSVVREELKTIYPKFDSLINEKGLKIKKVENITNVTHEYVVDTVSSVIIGMSGEEKIDFKLEKDCFQANGTIDMINTSIAIPKDEINKINIYLTDVKLNDTLTTFYFWEREMKKIMFIRLRIGRKHYYAKTISACKGDTKTESINLIKK
jgi:hypothetical protein